MLKERGMQVVGGSGEKRKSRSIISNESLGTTHTEKETFDLDLR